MEYTVITNIALATFEQAVRQHIKEGWKPQGGIATVYSPATSLVASQCNYSQAMIRNAEEE